MANTKLKQTHGGKRPESGRKPTRRDNIGRFTKAWSDKETAFADLRQTEAAVRRGKLLEVDDVTQAVATASATIPQSLQSMTDTLECSAGLSPEQAAEAESYLHEAMNALAANLSGLRLGH